MCTETEKVEKNQSKRWDYRNWRKKNMLKLTDDQWKYKMRLTKEEIQTHLQCKVGNENRQKNEG